MEKAAAFLETRRYAAYKGATTEFSKWEGITYDPKRNMLYTSMSAVRRGEALRTGPRTLACGTAAKRTWCSPPHLPMHSQAWRTGAALAPTAPSTTWADPTPSACPTTSAAVSTRSA